MISILESSEEKFEENEIYYTLDQALENEFNPWIVLDNNFYGKSDLDEDLAWYTKRPSKYSEVNLAVDWAAARPILGWACFLPAHQGPFWPKFSS